MNYGELKTAWMQYTHRNDIALVLSTIEDVTRNRIGRDAKLIENEKIISISHNDILPANFVKVRQVVNSKGYPVSYMTPQQYEFEKNQVSGIAAIYTLIGGLFKCGSGSVSLTYFYKPEQLINDADTNLILTNWPQLYIYGGAAEIKRWSEEPEQDLEEFYNRELFLANKTASVARSGDRPRMRSIGWD